MGNVIDIGSYRDNHKRLRSMEEGGALWLEIKPELIEDFCTDHEGSMYTMETTVKLDDDGFARIHEAVRKEVERCKESST